jgi:K(+)-stimulated pyrophosphate-energized sodium pump
MDGTAAARLMSFVRDSNAKPSPSASFDTDHLSFDTGRAGLRSGSEAELNTLASILNNCQNVHVTIAGYTDSTGNADANMQLSRNRADTVVAALANKGVPRDRMAAEGFGEQNPIADNSTAEGRARNRRVALLVTQK